MVSLPVLGAGPFLSPGRLASSPLFKVPSPSCVNLSAAARWDDGSSERKTMISSGGGCIIRYLAALSLRRDRLRRDSKVFVEPQQSLLPPTRSAPTSNPHHTARADGGRFRRWDP